MFEPSSLPQSRKAMRFQPDNHDREVVVTLQDGTRIGHVTVVDVSRKGLGLRFRRAIRLAIGETLIVRYHDFDELCEVRAMRADTEGHQIVGVEYLTPEKI